MYIEREVEVTLESLLRQFKVVLVTGARQVGKTTMVRQLLGKRYGYVTLDDLADLSTATNDVTSFFRLHKPPVIIDEVQYAPDLFRETKVVVDRSDERGLVVLTGSQTYQLMKGVSESLAGRLAIVDMAGLSLREQLGLRAHGPFVPGAGEPREAQLSHDELWEIIWRGSMPELVGQAVDWGAFWSGYERAYLERDVRDLVNIRDEDSFYRFMVACAARTGQLVNHADIAADVGASPKTVAGWISVLQASGLVRLVRPFWSNASKRMAKTPKLYFMDTGLACHLLGWTSPQTLERGAAAGQLFETFVVSEVLKSHLNAGHDGRDVWFYRDSRKREIDLVIQEGRVLHPVEVKKKALPTREDIANFAVLDDIADYEVGPGAVICQTERALPITDDVWALPPWEI